ncbi:hypothetical protein [Acuticoccus mangrovi]|uniref:Uncharacterized protein n=1 Tax=Acuticoccus mangrovi TaxID=2796142 RepID=A0A934IR63_9HYPH|nr:hypothetical protein [Acuticoccus mangrovi]MBJ3777216.1 hypothetical protein [Acuticoccus mangrovi]
MGDFFAAVQAQTNILLTIGTAYLAGSVALIASRLGVIDKFGVASFRQTWLIVAAAASFAASNVVGFFIYMQITGAHYEVAAGSFLPASDPAAYRQVLTSSGLIQLVFILLGLAFGLSWFSINLMRKKHE